MDSSVLLLGENAFKNCTSLVEVDLSLELGRIYPNCFANCTALKSIILPDALYLFYANSFANTGITHLTIPPSVTQIGLGNLLDYMPALEYITVTEGSYAHTYAIENNIPYTLEQ